jgi:peptide deformylase
MIDTMRVEKGVGLAAPQIGVSQQVLVIQMPQPQEEEGGEEDPTSGQLYVLCNPKIVRRRGEEEGVEGCLSLPGFAGHVHRATTVVVTGQDAQGAPLRIKAQGFLARVFQHEIDHLHGSLYIDHIEDPDQIWEVEPVSEAEESL